MSRKLFISLSSQNVTLHSPAVTARTAKQDEAVQQWSACPSQRILDCFPLRVTRGRNDRVGQGVKSNLKILYSSTVMCSLGQPLAPYSVMTKPTFYITFREALRFSLEIGSQPKIHMRITSGRSLSSIVLRRRPAVCNSITSKRPYFGI